MRVLFWGTPDFGLPALNAIREEGHEVVGVVTRPERPAGRGRALRPGPVKKWALAAGVPVLQPVRLADQAFLGAARELRPDVSVVAAYGLILHREALELPPLGSLNIHASLLPALRGPAPVNWAVIRGYRETGVTVQRMALEVDAGPVLGQIAIPVGAEATAGQLYGAAAAAGGELIAGVLAGLAEGRVEEAPQDESAATYAPKLDKQAARIDWSRPAVEVGAWMRGCDPWPAAWTSLGGRRLHCYEPSLRPAAVGVSPPSGPGTVIEAHPVRGVVVSTGSGPLHIGAVKPAGRRRMTSAEWARGTQGLEGSRFD